jgi:gluconokinase
MGAPSLVVMGVSGCGKSTLGNELAQRLGMRYVEGDELHPPANVERMAAGIALTDADRQGWLETIANVLRDAREQAKPVVVTCSALKRRYRDVLREGDPNLRLVFLQGDPALLAQRIGARADHYMPPSLLRSQLDSLEPPAEDEQPIVVGIGAATIDQTRVVLRQVLGTPRGEASFR